MDDINELIDAIVNAPERVDTEDKVNTSDGQTAAKMRQQAVLQLTQHPSAEIRQEAAEKLAETPGSAALQALSQLAQDEASEVRQQALASLSNFEQSEALQCLMEGLKDPDYVVRATAAETLGLKKAEQSTEMLVNALQDEYYMVRATAAEALGRLEAFLALPALQTALLDKDQWVRHSAAESLSQIEPEENLWLYLVQLNETDYEDQKKAIQNLGALADPRAVPSLVRYLKDEPDTSPEIINALTAIHDPKVVPALVETALFTDQAHLREQALIQAQMLSLESTVSSLADWLDPETPQYSERAIEALHQMPTQETTPVFSYALQHPDDWVKTVSLVTLNNRSVPAKVDDLNNILGTEKADLGAAALHNLLRFNAKAAGDALQTYLDSDAEWRRTALAENLNFLELEAQIEYGTALLNDENSDIREAVMKSLSHGSQREAFSLLVRGVQDEDTWVRQAALTAMGKSQNIEALPHLKEAMLQDEDFLVRAKAVEAMLEFESEELDTLLMLALDDAMPSVRMQAVHGILARARQSLPQATVERLLSDGDRHIQVSVLEHMRRYPDSASRALIAPLREASDSQVQSAAQAAYEASS